MQVLLGTAQFGGGYAEAAPSLTATQNAKAEELARIVRERTGQDLPRVEASPSADVSAVIFCNISVTGLCLAPVRCVTGSEV